MEHDVGKQIHCPGDVLLQDGRIIYGALLVGVGIEVAAHALQAVENVPRLAPLSALEGDVLAEMGESFFARFLIAGAGVYLITAIYYLAIGRQMDDAESVVECMCIVFHFYAKSMYKNQCAKFIV